MTLPCEIMPISRVQERPHSGKLQFGKNGVEGTRIWDVPWFDPKTGQDYVSFITKLLGYTIAGPYLTPQITRPDVFSAQFPWLYCQDISVEGEDNNGVDGWGRIQFQRAIITAKYMPYEMGESFNLASSLLSFKENNFSWIGPFVPPPSPPPFPDDFDPNVGGGLQNLQTLIATLETQLDAIGKQIQADKDKINGWATGNGNLAGWADVWNNFQNDLAIYQAENPQALSVDDLLATVNDLTTAFNEIPALSAAYTRIQNQIQTLNVQLHDQQNVIARNQALLDQYQQDLTTWQSAYLQKLYLPGVDDGEYNDKGANAKDPAKGTPINAVSTPVGKIVPLGEYTLEKHHMLVPDFGLYISMLGCVNADYFLGFPMWTLLFHGIDGKRTVLPNGSRCWDVTLKFIFNPNGHNMLYRPEMGRWEVIVSQKMSALKDLWLNARAQAIGKILIQPVIGGAIIDQNTLYHNYLYTPADFSVFLVYN